MSRLSDRTARRTATVRRKVKLAARGRMRLSVFRSSQHIHVQLIDDEKGVTLAAASSLEKTLREKQKTGANIDAAKAVGKLIAERAKAAGVDLIITDHHHFDADALPDAYALVHPDLPGSAYPFRNSCQL